MKAEFCHWQDEGKRYAIVRIEDSDEANQAAEGLAHGDALEIRKAAPVDTTRRIELKVDYLVAAHALDVAEETMKEAARKVVHGQIEKDAPEFISAFTAYKNALGVLKVAGDCMKASLVPVEADSPPTP